jgi:hypothetical protein
MDSMTPEEQNNALFSSAYEYQKFGKGDDVNIELFMKKELKNRGLDVNLLCKAHLEYLIKNTKISTDNMVKENRTTQQIIDELTNDLNIQKTSLKDIKVKEASSNEILKATNDYVNYMIKNISDSQNTEMATLLLNHNKAMDNINGMYRSDIINKTIYEKYLIDYRNILLQLGKDLVKYYDTLIKSISVGYDKEEAVINSDYYKELYKAVKRENDTFTNTKEYINDLYSGDGKVVEYELQYLEQSGLAVLILWYIYYIIAIIGTYTIIYKNVNTKFYKKIMIILIMVFYPQLSLYLELYAYNVLLYIHNNTTKRIIVPV